MKLTIFLIAIVFSVPALSQQKGTWKITIDKTSQLAETTNDSNSSAGVLCFTSDKSCAAYISADIGCDENSKYPLMINAKTGANSLTATCMTFAKTQFLIIGDLNMAVAAFESGSDVGFAIPMQSGQFRVVRFNSVGATAAIRQARTFDQSKSTGTTNLTL